MTISFTRSTIFLKLTEVQYGKYFFYGNDLFRKIQEIDTIGGHDIIDVRTGFITLVFPSEAKEMEVELASIVIADRENDFYSVQSAERL